MVPATPGSRRLCIRGNDSYQPFTILTWECSFLRDKSLDCIAAWGLFSFMKLPVLNIRLILFVYMLIKTSAKDQINSLALAPASLGVCLRGRRRPPPFSEGLFSLETAIHRDNESHPGALERARSESVHMRIWFLLCSIIFVLCVLFLLVQIEVLGVLLASLLITHTENIIYLP